MNAIAKPIWVAGAFGFIGRNLVKELKSRGHTVYGIGHGDVSTLGPWKEYFDGLLSASITEESLNQLKQTSGVPSALFHMAGGASVGRANQFPHKDFDRTVGSAMQALEWVRTNSPETKIIIPSSAAVYGDQYLTPISENQPEKPCSVYGFNKLNVENECRSYAQNFGLRIVIARIFSVYGAGLRKQLMWDLCNKLRQDDKKLHLSGTGQEIRDWIHVTDVAGLLIDIGELSSSNVPVINIGTGEGNLVRRMAEHFVEAWHGSAALNSCEIIFDGIQRKGDPFSLLADIGKLRKLHDLNFCDLQKGIHDFVRWYKEQ